MRNLIRCITCVCLGFFMLLPVNATSTSGRGNVITNDEYGIVDQRLYKYLATLVNQTQLYSNDLAHIEELTITNYDDDIQSITGLKHLHMPNLKVLNIAINTLDNIDDVLSFPSLKELNLYYPSIEKLPESIHRLSNLTTIHIEGGNLKQLPNNLYDIITLKSLTIKHLPIKELSKQITKLMYLEELVIDNVDLVTVPVEVTQLRALKHLELNGLELSTLPAGMNNLLQLEVLRLEDNHFKAIPEELFELLNLQFLSFKNNKLTTIDPHIQSIRRLRELDLSINKLQTLPIEMINLPSLKILDLANNEWNCLPGEFQYLSLTNVANVFDGYSISRCGLEDSTGISENKAPLLRLRNVGLTNNGYTNQDVIVESDQPVNFVINEVANVARDEAISFSLEGTYSVTGLNEFGVGSNTLSFTIDKTKPVIRITDNYNELGIYQYDVAIDANEDGYFVVNGVRQNSVSRLLIVSDHQTYTISFVDLAGNESNLLDFVVQAKADENINADSKNSLWLYVTTVIMAAMMGVATYIFLQKSTSDEE